MPKRTRTHPRTHTRTHIDTLSSSQLFWHTHRVSRALCGCESLSVVLVLSLHARGLVNYLPKRTQSSGGKRRWGRRPCFWGNLEFATFSWVTIHSRSNSRLADVMLSPPSLSISVILCLTLFCSPCTSYHSNFEKLELLKALVNVCVLGGFWVCCLCSHAHVCVCVRVWD